MGTAVPVGDLPEAFVPVDLRFSQANPPEGLMKARSDRLDGMTYAVDLSSQTCSCPDFIETRKLSTQPGEMARLCKHLVRAMYLHNAFIGANSWIKVIAEEGCGGPKLAWEVRLPTAKPMLVTLGNSSQWINVYAHTLRKGERYALASGPIRQFGWAVNEHRWSYGEAPPGAGEIRSLLKELGRSGLDNLILHKTQLRKQDHRLNMIVGSSPSFPVFPSPNLGAKRFRSGAASGDKMISRVLSRIFQWLLG